MLDYIERAFAILCIIISKLGYWGVGVGMMLGSACIPIPSELVLAFAGFMCADGYINIAAANIFSIFGSMTGSYIAYAAGFYGGRPLIFKYGRYLFISEHALDRTEKTFKKYGGAFVFTGRFLPVIRTVVSLPAGIAGMNLLSFTACSLAGIIPCNLLLIYLGYRFRDSYDKIIRPMLLKYGYIAAAALLAFALILAVKKIFMREIHCL